MADHVLVAGAGGLVGRAAMQHFAQKRVKTTAVSRRRPYATYGADFACLDLADETACAETLGGLTDITQIVFGAVYEEPWDIVGGWTRDSHVKRNALMLRNTVEAVDRASSRLRNVVVLQGPKAYGVHVRPMRPGAREDRDETRDIPNFYWEQLDYIRDKQIGKAWGWTVIRPALVIGMSAASALNLIAAVGVYGALLRDKGLPLAYPGGPGMRPMEATDTELMAHVFDWAGRTDAAQNQTFNVTNGEQFDLRDQWPGIAAALGMEIGPEAPQSLAEELPKFSADWDRVRAKHGLIAGGMDAFLSGSPQLADFVLAGKATGEPRASSAMSCIKIRQAGFNETLYSDAMFAKWFARYQADGLLPRP